MDDIAFICSLRLYLSVFPVASGVPAVAGLYFPVNDLYSPVSDFNSLIFVSNCEYSELLILYSNALNTLYYTDTYNIEYILVNTHPNAILCRGIHRIGIIPRDIHIQIIRV